MTKKRIADLLKEEVEKSDESAGTAESSAESAPEAQPKQTTPRRTRKTRTSRTTPSTTKSSTTKSSTAKSSTAKTTRAKTKTAAASTPASSATVEVTATPLTDTPASEATDISVAAEILKNRITELEHQLAAANQKVTDLQEDVKTHQDRVYELKDQLDAAQKAAKKQDTTLKKVSTELETAKDTIRQLTAAPPTEAASPPPAQSTDLKPVEKKPAHPIMGADLARNRQTLSARRPPRGSKSIPDYAILRDGQQNSMLSDDDIGWVD
ncbi:MAG: hypothetical protein AAFU71_00730 [Cyanobacteria bacterium J06632_22]